MVAPTEEDVGEYEEVQVDGGGEEAEPIKHAVDQGKPTDLQVEEHRETHIPPRSWCKWCVLGRGRGLMHKKSPGSTVPIVGMDYFFLTKGGVHTHTHAASWSTPTTPPARLSSSRPAARET